MDIDAKKKIIREDTTQLRNNAQDIITRVREMGEDAKHVLSEGALKTLERFVREGAEQAHEYQDALEDYIRNKPFRSVLISFAVGVMVTKLLSLCNIRR